MVLTQPRQLAAIVTSGDPELMQEMVRVCSEAARSGTPVRVFFRDESIPAIARVDAPRAPGSGGAATAPGLRQSPAQPVDALLEALAAAGDVRLYACSSSLYIWGLEARDLIPAIHGSRGLVAFLAEDMAGAAAVLTF